MLAVQGWAPSEFKSSRGKRGQIKQAAEDFMDEEDLVAFGGKVLETNNDYDFLGGLRLCRYAVVLLHPLTLVLFDRKGERVPSD